MYEGQYNYGLDLLKILSMFQVMILHILGHGGILSSVALNSINYAGAWFLEIASYCAVNVFVLISGYVGSVSKKINYGNGLIVWIQTLWYSIGIYVIFVLLGRTFRLREVYYCCTPILHDQYWYISSYIGMILLSPILNEIIHTTDAKILGIYTSVVLGICSFFSCINPNIFNVNSGYSTIWFMLLYLTGGTIRKNNLCIKIKKYNFLFVGGGYYCNMDY